MRIRDPGHVYELQELDAPNPFSFSLLVFVKREGEKFPGNVGHHKGTNMQEVLRAVRDRLFYLDNQIHDLRNLEAIRHIEEVIYLLEERAAERHGRDAPSQTEAISGVTCAECGHVGCHGAGDGK